MAASGSCGTGITWTLADNGTLTISGNGAISFTAQPWANYVSLITAIVIEEGITSICEDCFMSLSAVTEARLASTVTSFGSGAFAGCTAINSLYVDSVEYLVTYVTGYNTPLYSSSSGCDIYVNDVYKTHLVIPEGIKTIGDCTLYNYKNVVTIDFPNTLTTIGFHNFVQCANLEKVIIPDSVTKIEAYSFEDCPKLKEISLGDGITTFNTGFGIGLTSLEKLSIGVNFNCASPAFYLNQCTALTEIVVADGNAAYTVVDGILYSKDLTTVLFIPVSKLGTKLLESVTVLGERLYDGRTMLNRYTFPDSVTKISRHCFAGCTGLLEIHLPTGLTMLGASCFKECSGISVINLPKSVSKIDGGAFNSCTSLIEVIVNAKIPPSFGRGNTLIGGETFGNCPSLTAIKVPVGTGELYKTTDDWSSYADLIVESEEAGYEDDPVEPEEPEEPTTPTLDRTSMLLGWLMGRRMVKLKNSGNTDEPVAYLYNGVRLPPLPEYDTTAYPYVYIARNDDSSVHLLATNELPYYHYSVTGYICITIPYSYVYCKTDIACECWGDIEESTYDGDMDFIMRPIAAKLIWTNESIYNDNGSLFMEGTDPIPVYE